MATVKAVAITALPGTLRVGPEHGVALLTGGGPSLRGARRESCR